MVVVIVILATALTFVIYNFYDYKIEPTQQPYHVDYSLVFASDLSNMVISYIWTFKNDVWILHGVANEAPHTIELGYAKYDGYFTFKQQPLISAIAISFDTINKNSIISNVNNLFNNNDSMFTNIDLNGDGIAEPVLIKYITVKDWELTDSDKENGVKSHYLVADIELG